MKKILYYWGLTQLLLFQIFIFKTKTYYEDDKKQDKQIRGRTVIISNHRSFLDGIVFALKLFFQRMHFISVDFFQHKLKFLKPIVSIAGGIFVNKKGSSFTFIENSKKVIAKGHPILIFPEGDFKFTYEPSKFAPGYIMLAVKTGAKIVPIVNDFNYGLFKRVHIMVGNRIDLSDYADIKLTKEKIKEINDKISNNFLMLFYQLKRKKAERFSNQYDIIPPKKGDVVRIFVDAHYHYGIYLNANEVIQFGHSANQTSENICVISVSLKAFCGDKIPEVRTLKKSEKRFIRNADDVEKYAKSCLGQGGYSIENNNCADFANRVTLKI